jgi:phage-related protein (TIGR01555 family)
VSITPVIGKPKITLDEARAISAFRSEAFRNSNVGPATKTALDAFNNSLARIGWGTNNLLESTNYPLTRLSYNYILLQSLYRSNWIARKVIDAIAEDMVKNWLSFTTQLKPALTKKLDMAMKLTGVKSKVLEGLKWARLFGGAGAVMIIKGQESPRQMAKPLDVEDVDLDSFRGLLVFDRWAGISPSSKICNDIDRPLDFGYPESYRVNPESAGSFEVHASRVLRFSGRSLPNWEWQAENRWGLSEIEIIYEELKKRDNTSYNLASLIFRANIFELRQKGLANMISGLGTSAGAAMQFYNAIQAQAQLMSNQGIVVSDPEGGGLATHQYGFAGIADVYLHFMYDICGACEYPFSRLFGRPGGGLGDSNKGDEHTYYENLRAKQERELEPQMQKLMPVIAMSALGKVPNDLEWRWRPVRSMTEEEQADLAVKKTTVVVEAFVAGLISQKTALLEFKQQAPETELWTNITDQDIEAASADTQSPMEMMQLESELNNGQDDEDETKPDKSKKKPAKKKVGKAKDSALEDVSSTIVFCDLPIAIENPVGTVRHGNGWSIEMKHSYGYILGSEGTDGDEVDVFLGPDSYSEVVYVAHLGEPDPEDKAMLGFTSQEHAATALQDNYSIPISASWDTVSIDDFRRKIFSDQHAQRVTAA